jgi:hypothetical protein
MLEKYIFQQLVQSIPLSKISFVVLVHVLLFTSNGLGFKKKRKGKKLRDAVWPVNNRI